MVLRIRLVETNSGVELANVSEVGLAIRTRRYYVYIHGMQDLRVLVILRSKEKRDVRVIMLATDRCGKKQMTD